MICWRAASSGATRDVAQHHQSFFFISERWLVYFKRA